MDIFENSRYLEGTDENTSFLGHVGVGVMAQRLIHTQLPVSPHWDSIRRISRRLLKGDQNDQETYEKYVYLLCDKAARTARSLKEVCNPETSVCRCDNEFCPRDCSTFESDTIAAAIYTNRLSVVDELGSNISNLQMSFGVLPSPIRAAVEVENLAAVDLLFENTSKQAQSFRGIWSWGVFLRMGVCLWSKSSYLRGLGGCLKKRLASRCVRSWNYWAHRG
ncbi:hypothetical protein K458DRAFT_408222 [Lentithecium fluviatile CBS 122367]|uniref:Uncharacterized protein n=1 Tax=Lentithecium fluviatile CBS 122367 TaxID=1168545 RepID=A0A6G1IMA1_9PLEO|nr:hypothetical protein K458DRAFT_408222 [Lentithecium fluviatile CBS 122367]